MCGSDSFTFEKKPLIALKPLLTVLFAPSSFSEIPLFIDSNFDSAADLAPSSFSEKLFFSCSSFPPVAVLIADITVEVVVCIPAIAPETIPLIPPPAFVYAAFMLSSPPPVTVLIVDRALEVMLCTPAIVPAIMPLIPPPAFVYADFMVSRCALAFEAAWDIAFPIVDFTFENAVETLDPIDDIFSENFERTSSSFPPVKLFMKEYPAV
nr:MAG: hypothetical protein [Bacteriophage sp.]